MTEVSERSVITLETNGLVQDPGTFMGTCGSPGPVRREARSGTRLLPERRRPRKGPVMSYSMGYYGGENDYAAMYEEQEEQYEEPQPRQRGGQGLRNYAQRVDAENQDLKRRLREQEDAIRDLMANGPQSAGGAPQTTGPQQGGQPHAPRMTDAEQMQYQHMVSTGAVQTAAPMGSEAEMVARIKSTQSPEELEALLASQGNMT